MASERTRTNGPVNVILVSIYKMVLMVWLKKKDNFFQLGWLVMNMKCVSKVEHLPQQFHSNILRTDINGHAKKENNNFSRSSRNKTTEKNRNNNSSNNNLSENWTNRKFYSTVASVKRAIKKFFRLVAAAAAHIYKAIENYMQSIIIILINNNFISLQRVSKCSKLQYMTHTHTHTCTHDFSDQIDNVKLYGKLCLILS